MHGTLAESRPMVKARPDGRARSRILLKIRIRQVKEQPIPPYGIASM
jgi:hypothetical protein